MECRYRVEVVRKGENTSVLGVFALDADNAGRAAEVFFKAYPDHMVFIRDCKGIEPDEYLVTMPGSRPGREDAATGSATFGTLNLVDLSLPG
jgi:hypothetical protein